MYRPIPGTPIYDEQVADGSITSQFLPTYAQTNSNYLTPTLRDVNIQLFVINTFLVFWLKKPARFIFFLKNHTLIKAY